MSDRATGPWGDSSRHAPLADLERGLEALAPPADSGRVARIVVRAENARRETPERAVLTPEEGLPGDAWSRSGAVTTDDQVTLMRSDVAELLANGQPTTLFGDNLLVELDLCEDNLPTGSRLRAGAALLEVTPEPHTGCLKFQKRFGADALRLTAMRHLRTLRLRGIHARVVEAGEVAVGDPIEVVSRG